MVEWRISISGRKYDITIPKEWLDLYSLEEESLLIEHWYLSSTTDWGFPYRFEIREEMIVEMMELLYVLCKSKLEIDVDELFNEDMTWGKSWTYDEMFDGLLSTGVVKLWEDTLRSCYGSED